jgi:hypothetical protein
MWFLAELTMGEAALEVVGRVLRGINRSGKL